MRQRAIAGITLLILALMVAPAFAKNYKAGSAQGKGGQKRSLAFSPGPKALWQDAYMIEELGLSDDQIASLKKADFDFRERAIEHHSTMQKAQLKLDRTMTDMPKDGKAMRNAAQAVADAKSQGFMLQIENQISTRTILTLDQVLKLEAMQPFNQKRKQRYMNTME
jgi:hypothetical protein